MMDSRETKEATTTIKIIDNFISELEREGVEYVRVSDLRAAVDKQKERIK